MTYYLNKSDWYNSRIIPEGMNLDMLNTPARLDALLKPSIDLVANDSIVVDLGCGTGSLGLHAIEQGAKFVYFVEQDEQMLHILYNVLPNCIPKNNYKIINKDIQNLTKQDFDLGDPDIFVSEFYGPRLFDEGYVEYTKHLKSLYPNCYFIPEKFIGNFCLVDIDYNKDIWPQDTNLLNHFKFMYKEKGFSKSLGIISPIKHIGFISFDANKQVFVNSFDFVFNYNKECLLVGIMEVEHKHFKQVHTHIGWYLDETDYLKNIKISISDENYYNPKKEIV